jgi:transcriptional adapter 2-alpha
VPCFSEARSSRDHDPQNHAFRVIEQHSIPIYTPDWGADEELLLLEGAETYGLGSWAEIADHIGGCRSREEVRQHYEKTYIESSNFPLPKHASPDDRALIDEIPREEFQVAKKRRIEQRKEAAKNAAQGPPKQKPTASVPSCHEVQGYMPGRLEFETEYYNEAEEAVQHMQFDPGESLKVDGVLDPEVELKMIIMDIYNGRLRARVERKKIIFEHQLLEYKKNQAADKKRSKEEKELLNRAKPFARMMNHSDFVAFCEEVEYEQNLRLAITQLQEWRQNKIMDLKSGERFEAEKQQRAQRGSQFPSLDRLTAKALGKASLASEGPTLAATFVSPELSLMPYGGLSTPPPSDSEGSAAGKSHGLANGLTNGVTNGIASDGHKQRVKFVLQPLPNCIPLSYDDSPPDDLHLLTDEEKEVCRILRLYPKPYIVLKENVLREAVKLGGAMKKKTMRDICRIDATKASRLFDFWVHCGWLLKV